MGGFTGNPRGVRWAILLLLALFALGALGYCNRSSAEEAEPQGLSISFGVGYMGGSRCFDSMMLAQEIAERKWLGYLATHGDSNACGAEAEFIRPNIGAGIIRTTHLGAWTIGFGAGVMEHGDVVMGPYEIIDDAEPRTDSDIQAHAVILIRRALGKRLVFDFFHASTGKATHFNPGLNNVTIGVRF
jgi:hypothetical protein